MITAWWRTLQRKHRHRRDTKIPRCKWDPTRRPTMQMSFRGDKRQSTCSLLTACEYLVIYRWLIPTYPWIGKLSSTISQECAKSLSSSRWCCYCLLVRGSSRDSRYSARCRLTFVARLPLIPRQHTSYNFHPAGCIGFRSIPPPTYASGSKLDRIERK